MKQETLNNNFNDTLFEHRASIEELTKRIEILTAHCASLDRRLAQVEARVSEPDNATIYYGQSPLPTPLKEPKSYGVIETELLKATEHAEHLEAKIKTLKAERNDQAEEIIALKKELAGWYELFATKHLSHAKCVKASRDLQLQKQGEANDWQADRIKELNDQLANQGIIIKEYREKYESGCSLVSKMHAAAMGGKIVSPKQGVVEDIEQLRLERDAFKSESDDQAKAWAEIRTFIPDVNGLSLVGMVRRHVEELTAELAALKANNRYQSGYEDGAQAVIKQVRDLATKLKA